MNGQMVFFFSVLYVIKWFIIAYLRMLFKGDGIKR
jgi:uncharacterized membrane protein YhdT